MIVDSNNIFLVSAEIEEKEYMRESKVSNHQTIVIADDAQEAKYKYVNYWEGKRNEYHVSYFVRYITVTPAIISKGIIMRQICKKCNGNGYHKEPVDADLLLGVFTFGMSLLVDYSFRENIKYKVCDGYGYHKD